MRQRGLVAGIAELRQTFLQVIANGRHSDEVRRGVGYMPLHREAACTLKLRAAEIAAADPWNRSCIDDLVLVKIDDPLPQFLEG